MSEGWYDLFEHVAETLDIGPGTRVFEVDCGDGEFLFALDQNGYIVGGTDGDPNAVARAIAAMPDGIFQVGVATALDPGVPWDVVICRSFGARRDLSTVSSTVASAKVEALAEVDYMRGVLARMFAKATHAIAVLDVPAERQQWMLHALAEIGANAIQMESRGETFNAFARV